MFEDLNIFNSGYSVYILYYTVKPLNHVLYLYRRIKVS